jgi:DNA-binding XRE family transcriptional regulator
MRGMRSTSAVMDGCLAERLAAGRLPLSATRRTIRIDSGATLRDVATELHVSPMTVLRWEQGKTEPRLDHAIAYRALLDQLLQVSR